MEPLTASKSSHIVAIIRCVPDPSHINSQQPNQHKSIERIGTSFISCTSSSAYGDARRVRSQKWPDCKTIACVSTLSIYFRRQHPTLRNTTAKWLTWHSPRQVLSEVEQKQSWSDEWNHHRQAPTRRSLLPLGQADRSVNTTRSTMIRASMASATIGVATQFVLGCTIIV